MLTYGSSVCAQAKQALNLRLDMGIASFREDLLVPLAFSGPGIHLGVSYELRGSQHGFQADLSLGAAYAWNRFEHAALGLNHELGLGYIHLLDRGESCAWWLGAELRDETHLHFIESWDDAHGYWLASWSLGPIVEHERKLWSSGWLETRTELGLVGLMSRPPAYRLNKQDALTHIDYHFNRSFASPEWFSPLDVQLVRLSALLRFRKGNQHQGKGFGLGLEFQFARAKEPQPAASMYSGARLAYGWGL
ncbi:MAG TPA: hypothetical protein VHO25_14985 [Polyangiaceae bacterium]|nr:hypothetical protein [Polyangiaceae bacterium]